jgi:hypothetical protein
MASVDTRHLRTLAGLQNLFLPFPSVLLVGGVDLPGFQWQPEKL